MRVDTYTAIQRGIGRPDNRSGSMAEVTGIIANQIMPAAGVGIELVNDAAIHYGFASNVFNYQEKMLFVSCALTGAPGNLLVWVELSLDGVLYAMLGAATNVGATGNVLLPWTSNSLYARLACQCVGAGPLAYWSVQGWVSAGRGM